MSNAQHTPGPWPIQTVKTQSGICHKIGLFPWKKGKLNSACIYVDYPGDGPIEAELLANAYLIAAAPDLLEALEGLLNARVYADAEGMCYIENTDVEGSVEAVEKARSAIAKAKGE